MELVVAAVVAVMFGSGFYFLLRDQLLRVLIGTLLISNATLLVLLTAGRLGRGGPPLVHATGSAVTDPLPPALILTAIVIGFSISAFTFIVAARTYQANGSDDLARLRGLHDD